MGYAYENLQIAVFGQGVLDITEPNTVMNTLWQGTKEYFAYRAQSIHWQRVANDAHPSAARTIRTQVQTQTQTHTDDMRADGYIIKTRGHVVGMLTRDCHTAVLHFGDERPIAVLHCWRGSVCNPQQLQDWEDSVVLKAVTKLSEYGTPDELHAYILAGIAPQHFNNERYPEILARLRTWGAQAVLDDVCINIPAIVQYQLVHAGVLRTHIHTDTVDTFLDPAFGSYRAEKPGHNVVLVGH